MDPVASSRDELTLPKLPTQLKYVRIEWDSSAGTNMFVPQKQRTIANLEIPFGPVRKLTPMGDPKNLAPQKKRTMAKLKISPCSLSDVAVRT